MPLQPGSVVGHYAILAPLGAGGMGEVYRARDTRLAAMWRSRFCRRPSPPTRSPAPLRAGGAGRGGAQPSEHARALRRRHARRRALPRVRAARGRDAARARSARGAAAAAQGRRLRRPDRERPRRRARQGHRAPRPQAGEPVRHHTTGGSRSSTSAWPSDEARLAGADASVETVSSPHRAGRGARHGRLHVAGAGARPARRSSRGHLRVRRGALRDGDRAAGLLGRDVGGDAVAPSCNEEPPDLAASVAAVPPALERILRRCLEKNPAERFQSATTWPSRSRRSRVGGGSGRRARGAGDAPGAAQQTAAHGRGLGRPRPPSASPMRTYSAEPRELPALGDVSFQQLTFRQGGLHEARFGPDGTVFYSAHWGGGEDDVYFTPTRQPRRPCPGLRGRASGLGLHIGRAGYFSCRRAIPQRRTLARLSFPGGAPRELATKVSGADWSPNGHELAVISFSGQARVSGGQGSLRVEIGDQLVHAFLHEGDRIAFFERSLESGRRPSVDDLGRGPRREPDPAVYRSPDGRGRVGLGARGDELWFVSQPETGDGTVLRAIDRQGKVRDIRTFDGWVGLKDIDRRG